MRSIDEVIQVSLDNMVAKNAGFFESQVREWLPAISKQLQADLQTEGYQIVVKGQQHTTDGGRHHGR